MKINKNNMEHTSDNFKEPNFNDDIDTLLYTEFDNDLDEDDDDNEDNENNNDEIIDEDNDIDAELDIELDIDLEIDEPREFIFSEKKKDIILSLQHYTKYEIANLIGTRAIQIAKGAKIYVSLDNFSEKITPILIARKELELGTIPFKIKRCLPGGLFEYK